MKQYRLLRDNKESGPYAAEELIQLGLKKYDLVWVDGRSAAWRYPCEIDVFKPYAPPVDEQPFDRFFKKSSASATQQPVAIATVTETPAVKKEKPRFRIKADCNRIEPVVVPAVVLAESQPIVQTQPVTHSSYTEPVKEKQPVQTNTAPAWESMWLDWEQEKKAVANASASYKNVSAQVKALGGEEVLETKFSQSLDDIAGKYAESLLTRKKSSGSFSKYKSHLTAVALLIAIIAAGMWISSKWSDKTGYVADKTQQQDIQLIQNESASTETPAQTNDETTNNTELQPEENIEEATPVDKSQKQPIVSPAVSKAIKPATTAKQKSIIPAKNITTANVQKSNTVVKNTQQNTAGTVQKNYQPSATDDNGARSSVKRSDVNNNAGSVAPAASNNEIKREIKKAAAIEDYVDVESYPVSTGVQYNISNISDVPLDLVMLDLQYFDSNGRYLKGETLTIKNIEAGGSTKVNAPQNSKAAGIKYKVSMISSAHNDLNIIAD